MPLYLVATPIGNLEDMTLRGLRILKEVDVIACEDTRHSGRLLSHFGIDKPTVSYHEHNEISRSPELVKLLESGKSVAVITDAGTPGISDPAYRIVIAAIASGVEVIPIPGAVALISGLVASGLPTNAFYFGGFLPPKQKARRTRLEELRGLDATLVFYEAPHRIRETLADVLQVLGDRPAAACRELTKLHEEFARGSISQLIENYMHIDPRGEFVLVVHGRTEETLLEATGSVTAQLDELMAKGGLDRPHAIKELAAIRGITRKELYRQLLSEKDEEKG